VSKVKDEYYNALKILDKNNVMFCHQKQAKGSGWYNIIVEDRSKKQHHFTSNDLSDLLLSLKVVWGSLLGSPEQPTNNETMNVMPTPPKFPAPPPMPTPRRN